MTLRERQRAEARKLVEASAWRVHLAEADAGEGEHVEEFQAWLAQDERNAIAWRQVNGPWQLLGEHATSPEIIVARRLALARAQQVGRRRWRSTLLVPNRAVYAIAATLLAVVAVGFLTWQNTRFDVYRTGTGERRTATLADGSTVALDAHSEVRVRYSGATRDLQLVQGQAQFDVAHDSQRPFSVTARGQKVIATGTSFNVDLLESRLFVTLIQGHVVVVPEPDQSWLAHGSSRSPGEAGATGPDGQRRSHIELSPGEQLVISDTGSSSVKDVNVELATAWQTGRVVFEDETLAGATVRLNRYSGHALVIGDETTANLRISGVFKTSDINGFVATITTYFPVAAHMQPDGDVELTQRSQPLRAD